MTVVAFVVENDGNWPGHAGLGWAQVSGRIGLTLCFTLVATRLSFVPPSCAICVCVGGPSRDLEQVGKKVYSRKVSILIGQSRRIVTLACLEVRTSGSAALGL